MRKFISASLLAALAVAGVASAGTATATFPVSATVTTNCLVSTAGGGLAFGSYAPGGGALTGTTVITLKCTAGAVTVALNGGTTTGGTSIVPPQYAAIFAIINQKTAAPMGQGLINPKLYEMAEKNKANLSKVGILDITTGNNSYSPVKGYAAKKGFDVASGWGAIDFTNFVNAFAAFTP